MATASAIAIKHAEAQEEHAKAAQETAATMVRIEEKLDVLIELLSSKTAEGSESAAPAKTAKK